MEFGDSVGERIEQVGRLMRLAIPPGIFVGTVETKVRAEVDERNARLENLLGKLLALAVRERGENQSGIIEHCRIEAANDSIGVSERKRWMDVGDVLAGIAVADQQRRSDLWMRSEQAEQFSADVSACTENQGIDHRGEIGCLHNYAIHYA